MEGNESFLNQLSNFVTALINLAPSRNYVTQILYVVKLNGSVDYRILEEAYPEIFRDEYNRETFSKTFGVVLDERVTLSGRGFGKLLADFVDELFRLFENQEFRTKVGALLREEFPEGIPNLAREWVEVRIKGLASEPTYGRDAIKILRELLRLGRARPEDFERALNVDRGRILQCLDLLNVYKLAIRDYDGSYRPSEDLTKYKDLLEDLE